MQNRRHYGYGSQVFARQLPLITINEQRAALCGFSFMYVSIGLFFIALAWLVPNTSQPWISFWTEAVALTGLFITAHAHFWKNKLNLPYSSLVWLATALSLLGIDWIFRENTYPGDYITGCIYISSFFVAMVVGIHIKQRSTHFFVYLTFVAIISCFIATAQWLQLDFNRLYVKELAPQDRPFANSGQPNHLGTFLSLGIVATAILYTQIQASQALVWILYGILTWGAALTQSRTTFIQIIIFSTISLYLSKKNKITLPLILCIAPSILFFLFSSCLPIFNETLGISQSRPLYETGIKTSRFNHWFSMLEAIQTKPWWGFGWLHAAEAHINGTDFAIRESIFQYSHNIILDAMLWFGIPATLIFLILFSKDLRLTFFSLKNSKEYLSLIAFFLFLIHCLLEYPFAYIHILIIGGIFFGIAKENQHTIALSFKSITPKIALAFTTIASTFVILDYIKLEATTTKLRFQYAKIGNNDSEIRIPKFIVIDQAENYIKASYILPNYNITKEDVQRINLTAMRYGTQRLLFHSALAHAFVGANIESQTALNNICKIHSKNSCDFSKSEWNYYQEIYPNSIGKIEFPK